MTKYRYTIHGNQKNITVTSLQITRETPGKLATATDARQHSSITQ